MRLIFTSLCLVASVAIFGQTDSNEIDIQTFVEEIFQLQDEDLNYEDLYESLLLLYTNPLNLNIADREDLSDLYILDQNQVTQFLDYRSNNGSLISIYELQAIPGFDLRTIRKLVPFVTVVERRSDTRSLIQRISEEENSYFLLRTEKTLENSKGYMIADTNSRGDLSQRYLGDRNKVYSRFRVSQSKDFSIGFTAEKDAGEQFNFSKGARRYGPDFVSYHIVLKRQGNWKSIAIGDYQIQLGQGLLLGAGFNPGKGSETITTIRRSSTGIRPYTSVLESGFFRGLAGTYSFGRLDVTGFYSHQFLDAAVQLDTTFTDFDEFVSSIQGTGFHRTETEVMNKGQVREQVAGTSVMYNSSSGAWSTGLTLIDSWYDVPILKKPTNYNQFEFQGSNNYSGSLFSNLIWQNLNFFGEVAISRSGGIGAIGGLIASLSNQLAVSIVLRNYERDFHTFYGNAFGESSRNINERGVYWGLKFSPLKRFYFTAYYDRFKFPWLRFRAEAPSDGYEYLIRLNYQPTRKMSMYGQFRRESKERNSGNDANLQLLSRGVKNNYLLNLDYEPHKSISLKSRLQWSDYTFESNCTAGFTIIQDFNFEIGKLKIGSRFALFDVDDFENRQFAYEKDVLYAFSIPAYNGVGIRNYLLLQYKMNNKLTLWARLSRTVRSNVDEIGSGLDTIDENHKTDIKLQLRLRL